MIHDNRPATPQEALMHYGVKGMKWGVRQNHAKDTVSKEDRSAAKQNMKEEGRQVSERVLEKAWFGKTPLSETPYSQLSTQKRTIEAGAEFYRVTPRKNEVLRNFTYVSNNAEDRNRYNAVIPSLSGRGGKKSYKMHYESTFKATKDLTLPSEKARMDAFASLMDAKTVQVSSRKTLTGREYLKKLGYGRDVKKLDNIELGRKYHSKIMETAHLETPMATAYFRELSKRGYTAVQDDNDKGILSKDPLVIFNPNTSLMRVGVRQLTNNDINRAQVQFKGKLQIERR